MNIADRIQSLRKSKGISQEELADKIGVSRQAVSKWESEQSLPDMEKIILLSDFFDVTTDYLLKGIEPAQESDGEKVVARVCMAVGSAFNFIGLVAAILIWKEWQTTVATAVGLILMAIGCMTFAVGQFAGKNTRATAQIFWMINIWFLSLIPISCLFNAAQGVLGRFWWTFAPVPQMGNSIGLYVLCWMIYITVCVCVDLVIAARKRRE